VDGIRQGLIGAANVTYLNRPIFAGNANVTQAYDSNGNYLGDNGTVTRTVAPNTSVKISYTGPQVFGPPGSDLFSVLAQVSSDMRNNPGNLSNDLTALDNVRTNLQTQLSDVGARYNRVQSAQQSADDRSLTIANSLSTVEDVDLPKTIVQLQLQQVAYQAALGATAKVVTPSLVDFLR
jgi:flagellar hook-associated protein 3 FlgL